MNPLQNFLARFTKLLQTPGELKKPVLFSIKNITNITLLEKDIEIKEGMVHLKTHPAIKNAIFMRKKVILEDLKNLLGNKSPYDIR